MRVVKLTSHRDGAVLYKIGTDFDERRTLANNPPTIAFTLYDCDITLQQLCYRTKVSHFFVHNIIDALNS